MHQSAATLIRCVLNRVVLIWVVAAFVGTSATGVFAQEQRAAVAQPGGGPQGVAFVHPSRAAELNGQRYGLGSVIVRIELSPTPPVAVDGRKGDAGKLPESKSPNLGGRPADDRLNDGAVPQERKEQLQAGPGGAPPAAPLPPQMNPRIVELEQLALKVGALGVHALYPRAGLFALQVVPGEEAMVRSRLIAEAGSAKLREKTGIKAEAGAAADGLLEAVELNWLLEQQGGRVQPSSGTSPSNSSQIIPWGVERIAAPRAWQALPTTGRGGRGVRVAVLDSGIDRGHPDLPTPVKTRVYQDNGSVQDLDGHGTHVAGTIAARDNGLGVVGVAPEADLMIYQVCWFLEPGDSRVQCPSSAILQALGDASGDSTSSTVKAHVINMSLGGPNGEDIFCVAVQQTVAQGVVVVASAGNSALEGNAVSYPAACSSAISVAALDDFDDVRASFSTFNQFVDVIAPGVSVWSTYPRSRTGGYGYARLDGTSMAAPHVAGAAAQLIGHFTSQPGPAAIRRALEGTAQDLGGAGYDPEFGWGLINVERAFGGMGQRTDLRLDPVRYVLMDVHRRWNAEWGGGGGHDPNGAGISSFVTNKYGDIAMDGQAKVIDSFSLTERWLSGVFFIDSGRAGKHGDGTIYEAAGIEPAEPALLVPTYSEVPGRADDLGRPITIYGAQVLALADGSDYVRDRHVLVYVPQAWPGFPLTDENQSWGNYTRTVLMTARTEDREGVFPGRRTVVMGGDVVAASFNAPGVLVGGGNPANARRRVLYINSGEARINADWQVLYLVTFGDANRPSSDASSPYYGQGVFYNHSQGEPNVPIAVACLEAPAQGPGKPLWVGGPFAQISDVSFTDRGNVSFKVSGEYPDGRPANAIWFGRRVSGGLEGQQVVYEWTKVAGEGVAVPIEADEAEDGIHSWRYYGPFAGRLLMDGGDRLIFSASVTAQLPGSSGTEYNASYAWSPSGGLRRLYRSARYSNDGFSYVAAPGFPGHIGATLNAYWWGNNPTNTYSFLANRTGGTAFLSDVPFLTFEPEGLQSAKGVFAGPERADRVVAWVNGGLLTGSQLYPTLGQLPYNGATLWPSLYHSMGVSSSGGLQPPLAINSSGQLKIWAYLENSTTLNVSNAYPRDTITATFGTDARGRLVSLWPTGRLWIPGTSAGSSVDPYDSGFVHTRWSDATYQGPQGVSTGEDGRGRIMNNRGEYFSRVVMTNLAQDSNRGTFILRTTIDGGNPEGIQQQIVEMITDDSFSTSPETVRNMIAEPGEKVAFRFAIRSSSVLNLTGVTMSLVPQTPGVRIWRASEPEPMGAGAVTMPMSDIVVLQTTPISEPIWVSIPESHPCGEPIEFGMRLQAAQGGFSQTVLMPVGRDVVLATFDEAADGVQNPSRGFLKVPLTVLGYNASIDSGSVTISDVNVHFASPSGDCGWWNEAPLSMFYLGDATMWLVHPDGTRVRLIDRPGRINDQGGFMTRVGLCNATFDDDAADVLNDLFADGGGYGLVSGRWKPVDALGNLVGKPAAGEWWLEIQSVYLSSSFQLRNVSVHVKTNRTICGQPICGTSDVGSEGGALGGDGILDNNDFIVFIDLFFNQAPEADMGAEGGAAEPDGIFDNNDFIVFIDRFFAGC